MGFFIYKDMNVILPKTNNFNIDLLLDQKEIIQHDINNFAFYASIFPESKIDNVVDKTYRRYNILTTIPDEIFNDFDFTLLNKENEVIIENNKRKFIKSKLIGDYEDSIKRYTNLNKPIGINKDAQKYLNLPRPKNNIDRINVIENDLIYKNEINITEFLPEQRNNIFDDSINHPHINQEKLRKETFRFNGKDYIIEVLKWAKNKGIKYIYCIIEQRSYIINKSYVTPYIYYTIKGF